MSPDFCKSFIVELARESGELIQTYWRRPEVAVDTKSDASPVTIADRNAEELIRARIAKKFPDHGVIGEEFGRTNADAEWVWVLDPIDGTKAFITGVPLWGTLIALLHQGQPVLGCIHQPVLKEIMVGDGQVTTLNDRPVRCRQRTAISGATVLSSDIENFSRHHNRDASLKTIHDARLYRTWGDAYGYMLVASGWADVMLNPVMALWDIAALVPVIRGAGGVITDWQGGSPYPAKSTIACGNATLHAAMLKSLNP